MTTTTEVYYKAYIRGVTWEGLKASTDYSFSFDKPVTHALLKSVTGDFQSFEVRRVEKIERTTVEQVTVVKVSA